MHVTCTYHLLKIFQDWRKTKPRSLFKLGGEGELKNANFIDSQIDKKLETIRFSGFTLEVKFNRKTNAWLK